MKRLFCLTLSMSLILGLAACSPASTPVAPNQNAQSTQTASLAELSAKVQAADLHFFVQDAAGELTPLGSDQVKSFVSGSQSINTNDVYLIGGAADEPLLKSESTQREWLSAVGAGQAKVAYLGGGSYRMYLPKDRQTNWLTLQLQNQPTAYHIYLDKELQAARLVLSADGHVQGTVQMSSDFKLTQANSVLSMFQIPDIAKGLYSQFLPNFNLIQDPTGGLLTNAAGSIMSQFSDNLKIAMGASVPTTPEVSKRVSQIQLSDQQLSVLADDPRGNLLLAIAGRWKPSNPILETLAGGAMSLEVLFQNLKAYNAKATLGQTNYDFTGTIADIKMVNSFTLNVELKNAARRLNFDIAISNAYKLTVTLKQASGVQELLPLVGQEFELSRIR